MKWSWSHLWKWQFELKWSKELHFQDELNFFGKQSGLRMFAAVANLDDLSHFHGKWVVNIISTAIQKLVNVTSTKTMSLHFKVTFTSTPIQNEIRFTSIILPKRMKLAVLLKWYDVKWLVLFLNWSAKRFGSQHWLSCEVRRQKNTLAGLPACMERKTTGFVR